jgi:PAS domain S-box-containing protein
VGRSITVLIPEDRLGEEAEVLARLRRGEQIDHFETFRQAKDGRLLNVSLTVSPIKDRFGRIVGASNVARDITEEDRLRTLSAGYQLHLPKPVQPTELAQAIFRLAAGSRI